MITDGTTAFAAALNKVADPVARTVLDLHRCVEYGECDGCDFAGYEGDRPQWPCRTVIAVAGAVGVAVPPELQ